ncbi:MAG: phosphoribosylaminoimidazolesuccinocarboxamide synthase [Flavobacteriales bacterium]
MTETIAGTLMRSDLRHPLITNTYRGKVRDVYTLADGRIILVATDRISAFDVVLPRGIPHKGQVLSQLSWRMLQATREVAPNWAIAQPDPNVIVGQACAPVKVEMVVRGYLAGHAWRTYAASLPEGLRESDRLPEPIVTPSTKADEGHDEDITPEEILRRGLCTEEEWFTMRRLALALFAAGSRMAEERGLLLVDTKYEFGRDAAGRLLLIDEVHTPDSSRYFHAEGYADRQRKGERQEQLSKEFVREWLIAHGFMGQADRQAPPMDDAFVQSVTARYVELYERLMGEAFAPAPTDAIAERVRRAVAAYLG